MLTSLLGHAKGIFMKGYCGPNNMPPTCSDEALIFNETVPGENRHKLLRLKEVAPEAPPIYRMRKR